MRKPLALSILVTAAALVVTAVALAATPKGGLVFTGVSAHRHYGVSVNTGCAVPAKTCPTATAVVLDVTAGSRTKPIAGCPYGEFALSTGKLNSAGKFTTASEFQVQGKVIKFKASGTFTSPLKLQGSVTGPSACGGTDSFSLKGAKAAPAKTPPPAKALPHRSRRDPAPAPPGART
jgi:hypothetical protein